MDRFPEYIDKIVFQVDDDESTAVVKFAVIWAKEEDGC